MELKEGSYYMVKQNGYSERLWFFIYYNTDIRDDYYVRKTHNVYGYGYTNINLYKTEYNFYEKFFEVGISNRYTYTEITIDKAMEHFPDDDIIKINFLRKKRIKHLLSIKKD